MPSPRRQVCEDPDLSNIQPPVKLGVPGAEQITRCLTGGSDEIKHLLRHECRIIYECCACTSLFRSLANFLAHKRVYCKEDHLLPSNDLASHVSILRQYMQTKAAAMATLAEGTNNPATTDQTPASSTTATFQKNDETATNDTNDSSVKSNEETSPKITPKETPRDTPRRRKVKCPCETDKTPSPASGKQSPASAKQSPASAKQSPASAKQSPANAKQSPANAKQSPQDKSTSPSAKKRKFISEHLKVHLKKPTGSRPVNRSLNMVNGAADISHELSTDLGILNPDEIKKKSPKKAPVNNGNENKEKGKETQNNVNGKAQKQEPEKVEVMATTAAAAAAGKPETATAATVAPTENAENTTVKRKKKPAVTPYLLYPCLYCENVFPGTRMAIDHISAVHKKKKSLNVSKIRTKIRKKAFLWTLGKKMRRFQKKPKNQEKGKVGKEEKEQKEKEQKEEPKEEPIPGPSHEKTSPKLNENESKVGGRKGHVPHNCIYCNKAYLYKTVLERHQETCIGKTKVQLNTSSSDTESSAASQSPNKSNSPGSPTPKTKPATTTPKTPNPKTLCQTPTTKLTQNCHIIEFHIPGMSKSEPNSPVQTPNSKIKAKTPNTAPAKCCSKGSDGVKKSEPVVIPVRAEYPCPYCHIRPKKAFEQLFKHISTKHKEARPSRKRVVRFLHNAGYKCSWCKTSPRYFKNRIMLNRHKTRVHGIMSSLKVNGNKTNKS